MRSRRRTTSSCRRRWSTASSRASGGRSTQQPGAGQEDLRRRGQDRGRGPRGVPQDRRAARAPRPGARRDRREGQDRGRRRTRCAMRCSSRRAAFPARSGWSTSTSRRRRARSSQLRAPIFEDKVVDFIVAPGQADRAQGVARGAVEADRSDDAPALRDGLTSRMRPELIGLVRRARADRSDGPCAVAGARTVSAWSADACSGWPRETRIRDDDERRDRSDDE